MTKRKKVKVELINDCGAGKAGDVVSMEPADAGKLIASGDAKAAADAGAASDGTTEVALLVDCIHGKAGAVVELSDADADVAVGNGHADDSESAVAHRKSANAPAEAEKTLEA